MDDLYQLLNTILENYEVIESSKQNIPPLIKHIDKKNELVGEKYNMFTVLERTDVRTKNGSILYKCQCDCGNIVFYPKSDIKKNTSCGCYRKSRKKVEKMMNTMKFFENTSVSIIEGRRLNKNNTSGVRGVSFNRFKNKWCAYLKIQGKNINLGAFDTKEDAIIARQNGEKKYFAPIIEKYYKVCNNDDERK